MSEIIAEDIMKIVGSLAGIDQSLKKLVADKDPNVAREKELLGKLEMMIAAMNENGRKLEEILASDQTQLEKSKATRQLVNFLKDLSMERVGEFSGSS